MKSGDLNVSTTWTDRWVLAHNTTKTLMHMQIVCHGDAVAALDLQYLMLAVAVECCPMDFVFRLLLDPVKNRLLALMCDA